MGLELTRTILGMVRARLLVRLVNAADVAKQAATEATAATIQVGHGAVQTLPFKRRRTRLARCGPVSLALAATASNKTWDRSDCVLAEVPSITAEAAAAAAAAAAVAPKAERGGDFSAGRKKSQPLQALEDRWLRFAANLRPDIFGNCNPPVGLTARGFFGAMPRGRLLLSRLRFGLVLGELAADEVETTFTGMLAQLCVLSSTGQLCSSSGGDGRPLTKAVLRDCSSQRPPLTVLPRGMPGDEAPRCVAIAFVHSFDFARGEVSFFSPATPEILEGVNAVLRGSISWEPNSKLGLDVSVKDAPADYVSPMQPYCSAWMLEGMAVGAKAISGRRGLKRRSHVNDTERTAA